MQRPQTELVPASAQFEHSGDAGFFFDFDFDFCTFAIAIQVVFQQVKETDTFLSNLSLNYRQFFVLFFFFKMSLFMGF
jgi:hypothetical protein